MLSLVLLVTSVTYVFAYDDLPSVYTESVYVKETGETVLLNILYEDVWLELLKLQIQIMYIQ